MRKSSRGKRRGMRALFCFLLAAELMLGELGTSAQAEGTNAENFESADVDVSGNVTEEEGTEEGEGGGEEKPGEGEGGEEEKPGEGEGGEEETPGEGEGGESGGEENPDVTESGAEGEISEPPAVCICETLCAEEDVNVECPVCVEDYLLCLGEEEEEVQEEEISLLSEEEVEYLGIGNDVVRLKFRITSTDPNEVELYEGSFTDYGDRVSDYTIPDTVTDSKTKTKYSVVSIRANAFLNKKNMAKSLTLPDSIRSIGEHAFDGSDLESITLPGSLEIIQERSFQYCSNLERVIFQDRIKTIGEGAFFQCKSLREVNLPDSVIAIEEGAFASCESLETVNLPKNLTKISNYAFNSCTSLREIKIPSDISTINEGVFSNCTSLKTVEVGAKVRKFDYLAFSRCTSLATLKIAVSVYPGWVETIWVESTAFEGASSGEIIFLTPDGSATYPKEGIDGGPTLVEVSKLYDLGEREWCLKEDAKWYGWKLPGGSPVKVNFSVHLDGKNWEDHNKSFVLRASDSTGFLPIEEALTEDGTYRIFEDTGIEGMYRYQATGNLAEVHVLKDSEVTFDPIEYYTVTFYDGDNAYGEDTPQAPQIVMKGKYAVRPKDPEKTGCALDKWVTSKTGAEEFKFSLQSILKTTNVYASWTTGVYKVTLNVEINDTEWTDCQKRYAIKKEGDTVYTEDFSRVTDGKYGIYEVRVDGTGAKKYLNTDETFTVNGEPKTVTLSYYRIITAAGLHGNITLLSGEKYELKGKGASYEAVADAGYCIESLTVDGEAVAEAVGKTSYKNGFIDIKEPHTVQVTFKDGTPRYELRVKIRKDDGEWINNQRRLYVRRRDAGKFMMLTREGYEHTILLPDETYRLYSSLRPEEEFAPEDNLQYMDDTRIDVTMAGEDKTIYLDFYSAYLEGENVTLPKSPIHIRKNSSALIEIRPDSDCVISSVKLDGVEVDEERLVETRKELGFRLLPEETVKIHRIEINGKPKNVDVHIRKNGQLWTDHGKTIKFHKDDGDGFSEEYSAGEDGIIHAYLEPGRYTIYDYAEIGGKWRYRNTGITFEADQNVQIVPLDYFTVTSSSAGSGGSIDPSGENIVLKGTDCAFQIKAHAGYSLKNLIVDEKDVVSEVTEEGVYYLKDIQSPKSVSAIFEGGGMPAVTYDVTITVNKDKLPWGTENSKAYVFKEKDEENYTESYTVDATGQFKTKLKNGTYGIYEIVNTAARATEYRDTKVSVEVDSKETATVVDYYTVTFHDGEEEYGAQTDQRPQIVLKNENAVQPASPNKAGYSFDGWKTMGGTVFDFTNSKIADTTRIYASWTAGEKPMYTITASAGEGGSISANGAVSVTEGASQTFHITAYAGYKIKSVLVDGVEQGAVENYQFTNVTGDHKIEVTFEKTGTGSGGGGDDTDPDKPGGNDTDPDKPGGGDTDPDKPGGGDTDPDKPGGNDTDPDKPGGNDTDPDKPGGNDTDPDKPGGNDTDPSKPSGGGNGGGTGSNQPSGGDSTGGSGTGANNSNNGSAGDIIYDINGNIVSVVNLENANGNTILQTTANGTEKDAVLNGKNLSNGKTAGADGKDSSHAGEPKTGDTAHYKVYATIAMIAGIVYLLLFLLDGMKSMTEDEKNRLMAYLLGWAKKGKATALRRYIAITAIFFLLVYYYALGRCTEVGTGTDVLAVKS